MLQIMLMYLTIGKDYNMTEHISTLDQVLAFFAAHPEVTYLVTFVLLSYMVKRNFSTLLSKVTFINWQTVYTVLVLASLLAVPFIALTEATWQEIALMYAVGTSLHELLIEKLLKVVKK